MMRSARARVIVTGRVQGVFFRESTRRKAIELGLCGWVRNLPDLSVEWVAEGDASDVQALIRWCREGGPMMARVDRVDVLDPPEGPLDRGFLVLR
jgi:acylphosphatase